MKSKKEWIGIFIAAVLIFAVFSLTPVSAQPTNGNFETGDLTGWTTQGNVEVLQSTNFTPCILPPEGSNFVLLSNGPDDSPAPDSGDLDGNGLPDNDTTILNQTFSGEGQLCFVWAWLTSEESSEWAFDDFFLVRLDGIDILNGSADGPGISPFPNVSTNDTFYEVSSPGPTNESEFLDGRSSFQTFCTPISSGTHTIEFVVADQGNHGYDSGILIDVVTSAPPTPVTVESALVSGIPYDTFQIGDPVYAIGSGYVASTDYNLYIRKDQAWMGDGSESLAGAVITTNVTTNTSGYIAAGTQIWDSCVKGTYDIVVDVNGNGYYDAAIDALDANVDVGFEGIPEFSTIAIPVVSILGLLFFFNHRKRREE